MLTHTASYDVARNVRPAVLDGGGGARTLRLCGAFFIINNIREVGPELTSIPMLSPKP